MSFLNRFRRITTSGDYMAELDGLRFIAIIWVVLFHSNTTINGNSAYRLVDSLKDFPLLNTFYSNGFQGVELFFAISGFILAYPFARQRIQQGKKVNLKSYFLRRLTRLEPPYVIAMTAFFIILVVKGDFTFGELFPSLLASLVYLHFIIFAAYPYITMIAWSLEVEVQFYILAPLLSRIFSLRPLIRRIIMLAVILIMPLIQWYLHWDRVTIYQFIQYFFCGFLLADLYIQEKKYIPNRLFSIIIGLLMLTGIFLVNHEKSLTGGIVYPIFVVVLYYLALHERTWKKLFSIPIIATVGGMCYSIYLLHFPLMSLIAKFSHLYKVSDHILPNLLVNTIVTVVLSVVVSAGYFVLIEKPCMDKNWHKKLWAKAKIIFIK